MFGLSKVDKIKRHYNLVDFIESRGVQLKKNGSGYIGLCPFHEDNNPSLRVTPEKSLWNCMSCDKGGDVITFHELTENISNKQAIHELYAGIDSPESISSPSTVDSRVILNDIIKIYKTNFEKSKSAQDYLKNRGISKVEHWKHFNIGYSDGRVLKELVQSNGFNSDQLKELGLLNEKGNESFYKCITIPIENKRGEIVGLYGRSIEGDRQMYLKGKRRGVFNGATASTFKSVIIVESIIDALSMIELDRINVIPIYGTNGFTQDHRNYLTKHNFDEIIFCLDQDEAGLKAESKIREELSSLTAKMSRLLLPEGINDPNDLLLHGAEKGDLENLIQNRILLNVDEKEQNNKSIKSKRDVYDFDGISYRVKGLKGITEESMKVVLTADNGAFKHTDRIDLYLSKARQSFASAIAEKLMIQESKVESDLQNVCLALEEEQLNKEDSEESNRYEVSHKGKRTALSFLKRKDLLGSIVKHITEVGCIGQDKEKLLLYLSATGRITDKPIHISIQSSSSSGKSDMMEKVSSLFPNEDVIVLSRVTPQALFYMESLKGKVVIIDERSGSEEAELALRSLMSRGKLSHATVSKDDKGNNKATFVEVDGPATMWDSTTVKPSEDNRSRVFELFMDESENQTRKIHHLQRLRVTREGQKRISNKEDIRDLHHNIQRLLKPIAVVIPFEKKLVFPAQFMRARRDHDRVLQLIINVALLHQMQREIKVDEVGEYIEATIEDYEVVYDLIKDVLENSYAHINRDSRDLLSLLFKEVSVLAEEVSIKWNDYLFNRRQVREWTGWSDFKVRACMRELVRMEYVYSQNTDRGRGGYRYRLAVSPEEANSTLKLITPEELRQSVSK